MSDQDYFARRADDAEKLAQRANDPGVRNIHLDMAKRYKRMATVPRDLAANG